MTDTLSACRALLLQLTPLRTDCGRYCGAACCGSLPGEESGMLLFPGEEALYGGQEGFTLRSAPLGPLLVCSGHCDRALRPLACMLFPLLPLLQEDGTVRAAVDRRAYAVCPLAAQGLSALRRDFVDAVAQAGRLLAADPAQVDFLRQLSREQALLAQEL